MTFNRGLFSSASHYWATPQEVFNSLDAEFHFTLDACATPENAKCARFYTEQENGLWRSWDGVVFVNPPYGRLIGEWIQKAYWEAVRGGCTVVMLLPARTDTRWWHGWVMKADEIRFIRGRLKFGGAKTGAPFPSCIVVFRARATHPPLWEGE